MYVKIEKKSETEQTEDRKRIENEKGFELGEVEIVESENRIYNKYTNNTFPQIMLCYSRIMFRL